MSHKFVIAVDIDDVIADSTESLRRLVNKRLGVNLTKEDYKVPGDYRKYYEHVWSQYNLTDKIKYVDLEDEMIISQSHVPLMAGAEEAVHELGKISRIIFITARHVSWEQATREWFKDVLAHDDIELYFSEGMRNTGAMTKGQLCRQLGADWLIDDNPRHLLTAWKEGIRTILFGDYGWHHAVDTPDTTVRCKDWRQVMEYFQHGF